MARTEAPASSESRRQQQLTTPAATAPLLDSTASTVKPLTHNAIDPEVPSLPCITPRALGICKQTSCQVLNFHDGVTGDRGLGTSCRREKLLHCRSARG
jgi:hypothetical protein